MSKKDIITFYNNINSFLVKHGYSLNKTYYYYDCNKGREIVRKYKTDEKSLKYLVDKDCSIQNSVFSTKMSNGSKHSVPWKIGKNYSHKSKNLE